MALGNESLTTPNGAFVPVELQFLLNETLLLPDRDFLSIEPLENSVGVNDRGGVGVG